MDAIGDYEMAGRDSALKLAMERFINYLLYYLLYLNFRVNQNLILLNFRVK